MGKRKYANVIERLMAHVVLVKATGCWRWVGHCDEKGYGKVSFRVKGKKKPVGFRAHRVMWEQVNGPLPPGDTLDHLTEVCIGEPCIHPDHLQAVTRQENSVRMQSRRRGQLCLRLGA